VVDALRASGVDDVGLITEQTQGRKKTGGI
jgi:hypothetical protein